jgi:hypothetical protein
MTLVKHWELQNISIGKPLKLVEGLVICTNRVVSGRETRSSYNLQCSLNLKILRVVTFVNSLSLR